MELRKDRWPVNQLRNAFTLIELMVVMGLIAALALIAVPAFQNTSRGATHTAAFQLNTTLSLARQMAITTRQTTYVVFPTEQVLQADPGRTDFSMALRSYAIYGTRDEEFLTDFQLLPAGVYFNTTAGLPNNVFNNDVLRVDLPFPRQTGDQTDDVTIYAVGFRSDGPVAGVGTTRLALYLSAGTADLMGRNVTVFDAPQSDTRLVRINPITGQTSIRKYDED